MMEKINLRLSNMVFTGRITKRGINLAEVMRKSAYHWNLINEETSPILQLKIPVASKTKNIHGKIKTTCISIWHSGAINIVGVTSKAQADKAYRIAKSSIKGCLTKRNVFLKKISEKK